MTTTQNLTTSWFTTDNKEGVVLGATETISVTTNPEIPGPRNALGTKIQGNNGSTWMFVQATATVTSGNVVAIDDNFAAQDHSPTLAASLRYSAGIAQFGGATILSASTQQTAQPGDYFWACLEARGGLLINVGATCAVGVEIYLCTTPIGSVTSSVGTGACLGTFCNTTFTASASNSVTDFMVVAGRVTTSA